MKTLLSTSLILLTLAIGASASTLYIGNDTNTAVAVWTSGGVFVQSFGQNHATGSAINSAGDVWTVAPAFGANNVVEYSPTQTVLNTFTAAVQGQWIEDMGHGTGNTLWVGTFEGDIFALNDQTGAILSSFVVANSSYTGVSFDGTNLWVSGGLTSDNLFQYSTSGALLKTVAIGNVCMGLGYDASDGTLYCGDLDVVRHYSTAGVLLGSFAADSFYHDGLEVANVGGGGSVPEPTSLLLIGTGLIGLVGAARRRTR